MHTSDKHSARPFKTPVAKRVPAPTGRTLHDIVTNFRRWDGSTGLRVREMTGAMRLAAETLRVALDEPERLSLANIFGLAQLVADLFHQVATRYDIGLLKNRRQPRLRALHARAGKPDPQPEAEPDETPGAPAEVPEPTATKKTKRSRS